MADVFSKKARSRIMSRIRSKNTNPEILLRKALEGAYLRYQPGIIGKPDFGSASRKIAIFVDGCFWHKCPECHITPKSNKKYWLPKLNNNAKRDRQANLELKKKGYKVIRLWEHEIKKDKDKCAEKIKSRINR